MKTKAQQDSEKRRNSLLLGVDFHSQITISDWFVHLIDSQETSTALGNSLKIPLCIF